MLLTLLLSPQVASSRLLQGEPGRPGLGLPSRPRDCPWLCCPHMGSWLRSTAQTHGGQHWGSRLLLCKTRKQKATATICHQHSSEKGHHRSKHRQGHNFKHTQTLWVGCPQDNRIRQDRSPEDHTGTYSQPSRDAGTAQTFNYPEAGQQSQTKKLSETLPPSVPPETEVGRKREGLRDPRPVWHLL